MPDVNVELTPLPAITVELTSPAAIQLEITAGPPGPQGPPGPITDHNNLPGRSAPDTHPISSITGLATALGGFVSLTLDESVGGIKTFTDRIVVSDTTISTSPTTGALVVAGGIATGDWIYVAGAASIGGEEPPDDNGLGVFGRIRSRKGIETYQTMTGSGSSVEHYVDLNYSTNGNTNISWSAGLNLSNLNLIGSAAQTVNELYSYKFIQYASTDGVGVKTVSYLANMYLEAMSVPAGPNIAIGQYYNIDVGVPGSDIGSTITKRAAIRVSDLQVYGGTIAESYGILIDTLSSGTASTQSVVGIRVSAPQKSGTQRRQSIWAQGDIQCDRQLLIKEGTNAAMGVATLVAGTVTVPTTMVTANSRIFITAQHSSGIHAISVASRVDGVSFTITSASASDTRQVAWLIINPGI